MLILMWLGARIVNHLVNPHLFQDTIYIAIIMMFVIAKKIRRLFVVHIFAVTERGKIKNEQDIRMGRQNEKDSSTLGTNGISLKALPI